VGTAIRVGGDEFLAIVRSEHVADVNDAVKKMTDLQKERSEGLPISLEVAYGVAYKHEFLKNGFSMAEETHIDAEKVYHLSDERMYAMKAKMKSKLARL
jgi:GGDEF domain-containing protein